MNKRRQHRIVHPLQFKHISKRLTMQARDHLVGNEAYDWLGVNDSRENLLLVAWWSETVMPDGSLTAFRGLAGTLDKASSCMCSNFGKLNAANSGNVTGGAFFRGQERSNSTGLGESGGSGKAHADTLGNSYDGMAAIGSAAISCSL